MVVYDAGYGMALDFISSGKNSLLVDSVLKSEEKRIGFAAGNHWIYAGIKTPNIQLANSERIQSKEFLKYRSAMSFRGKTILLLDGKVEDQLLLKKSEFDYVFVTSNPKINMKELDSLYHPNQIIINANNSFYLQKKWKTEAIENNVPVWFISDKGAFMKEID